MFEALRWRLTAWYVLVFCTVFVVVGLVVFVWANRRFSGEVDRAIARVSADSVAQAQRHNQIVDADADVRSRARRRQPERLGRRLRPPPEPRWVGGHQPQQHSARWTARSRIRRARARSPARTRARYQIGGRDLRLSTFAVHGPDGTMIGFVQAGKSVEEREASLRTLAIVMAGGGVTGLVLAAVGGLLVAGIAIRPVKRSYRAAARVHRRRLARAAHTARRDSRQRRGGGGPRR